MTDADDKLKRLYRLIEEGVTEFDDVLKDRLNTLKAERDRAKEALARAQEHQSPRSKLTRQRSIVLREPFGRASVQARCRSGRPTCAP